MEVNTIRNLDDLYNYVKEGKIDRQIQKKKVLKYEMKRIKRKKNKGIRGRVRNFIVAIYPLRYMLACIHYKKISSFRDNEFRNELSNNAKTDILKNIDKYKQVYDLLDKKSKHTYLLMLLYRLTGDYALSMKVCSPNEQYFSDRIQWKCEENIIDCGAYVGDTLSAFLRHKVNINNYYLFELDDTNYEKLKEVCKVAESEGIKTHPKKKGVYSCTTTLYFESDADSSRLVNYPTETSIPVISIDEDINTTISFIKMDIEGSELEAINGAIKTIRRDKPVLAICIYHKQEDFWKLPLRIKEICPEYTKFWIEQYSPWDIETVLYVQT